MYNEKVKEVIRTGLLYHRQTVETLNKIINDNDDNDYVNLEAVSLLRGRSYSRGYIDALLRIRACMEKETLGG